MVKTAVILAAGRGTKMWPYGDTWAKAALPVANRPVIQWQIESLRAAGITNFVVVGGHLMGQIREAAKQVPHVSYLEQSKPTGTADALLVALKQLDDSEFLVVYGDVLFTSDSVKPLLEAANETGASALVKPAPTGTTLEWLCANAKENRLTAILGHPREASHQLCGLYRLNREIIPHLEQNPGYMLSVEVGNMPPAENELAQSLSQYLSEGNPIAAVETKGVYADLDKPWHYLDANSEWLIDQGSKLNSNQLAEGAIIEEGAELGGYVVLGEGSKIGHDVKIRGNLFVGKHTKIVDGAIVGENSAVGDHAIVREYCYLEPWTSIGNRCVAGHCTEFGGIMMENAYSFHYGEYWGILGRSADLGAATVCGNLRFDDQNTIHRIKGRREQPRSGSANAVYLGDYTRTGVNTILMPGVKMGAYSVVGAGVVLQEDVPNNTLLYVKQELERRSWGPEKYGW